MATYPVFSDPGSTTATALDTTSPSYIGGSLTNTANIFQNSLSSSDTLDLYKFTTSSSSIVTLGLDSLTSNADLTLLDSAGNSISSSNQTGTTPESIRANLAAGTYYAKLSFIGGGSNTNYNLSLVADSIQESGRSDNTRLTAFDIGTINRNNLTYSTTDFVGTLGAVIDGVDYYKFSLSTSGIVKITLDGLGADANLTLRNSSSSIIGSSSNSGTTPDSITANRPTGTYLVQVSAATNNFTNYNLKIELIADPVDNAGNTTSTARNISPLSTNTASYPDYVNSSDDKDYYRFDLTTDALVNFGLTTETANADLQLLNGSGGFVQNGDQQGTYLDSIRRSLTAGTYYLLVAPTPGVATNYTLSASATAVIGADQAANTRTTGKDFGNLNNTQTFNEFVGNIDTDDYYRFNLVSNGAFNLTLSGLTDNADVELLNSYGNVIQKSTNGGSANETINANLSRGNYYLHVYTSGLANTFYNLAVSGSLQAQMLDLRSGSGSSNPENLTALDGTLYFSANDDTSNGVQLWKSNGAGSNTSRLTNINPGGFNPANFTALNHKLYFTGNDGVYGTELWVYNGTTAQRLSDINPNSASSNPGNLTVVVDNNGNKNLFFTADDGMKGRELWIYDGTNVRLVQDIYPGPTSSNLSNLTAFNGKLYFTAQNPNTGIELWSSDGTTNNAQVIDIAPGKASSYAANLTVVDSTLYLTAKNGLELRKYENGSTSLVYDFSSGSQLFTPDLLTAVGSTLYFITDSNDDDTLELWKSNGTANGTIQVSTNLSGFAGLNLTAVGSNLYFNGLDATNGLELWKSNGTSTTLVKDIWVGNEPNNSSPTSLVNFNGILYFAASDSSNNREVWSSDGTDTHKVSNINTTGNANPAKLTVVGTQLFFTASNGTNGTELWVI